MPAELKTSSHGATMVLTLHNPDQRNALGPAMYAAGIEALNAAGPEVRSVVIVGSGGFFCAGGDLQRLQHNRQEPPEVQAQSIDALHLWLEEIRSFPCPVIAAVEGAAAGAGFSLALGCDFIVAASNSVFAMSHTGVALSPDGGGSWQLARYLPRQLASELIMLGQRIDAERLRHFGIVNRVCAPGSALDEALSLAEQLNQRAPNALASTKELLSSAMDHPLGPHLTRERDQFVLNLHHANAGIGIGAFLGKTKPDYE